MDNGIKSQSCPHSFLLALQQNHLQLYLDKHKIAWALEDVDLSFCILQVVSLICKGRIASKQPEHKICSHPCPKITSMSTERLLTDVLVRFLNHPFVIVVLVRVASHLQNYIHKLKMKN